MKVPLEPLAAFNVGLHVGGSWTHGGGGGGGAWCVEWGRDAREASSEPQLRLCFNASSRTQYWEQASSLLPSGYLRTRGGGGSGSGGGGGSREGSKAGARAMRVRWTRVGHAAPLDIEPTMGGRSFEIEVGLDKMAGSYSVDGGPWRATPNSATLLQLQRSVPVLCSYGATLRRLTATIHNTDALALLPAFHLPSGRRADIRNAPKAFEEAKEERGPSHFRFLNPSFVRLRRIPTQPLHTGIPLHAVTLLAVRTTPAGSQPSPSHGADGAPTHS